MGSRKKAESCDTIEFNGGQILVHETDSHTIIEIHTELGWRMGPFANPFKTQRGGGSGKMDSDARVFVTYSKKKHQEDKANMERRAEARMRRD